MINESNEALHKKQLEDAKKLYLFQRDRRHDQRVADLEKRLSTIDFLRNQLPAVKVMIASDPSINQASAQNYGRTPVMLAAAYCDLPVVKALLERSDVDVLGHDAFGNIARDLAFETSWAMYPGDAGFYQDDCDSVIKLLRKRELEQRLQQRFVDDVRRRQAAQKVLSEPGQEQLLPSDLSNIVGEYIIPRPELQRSNQPAPK